MGLLTTIFIHIGKTFPDYLNTAIKQAQNYSRGPIAVVLSKSLQAPEGVIRINYEDIIDHKIKEFKKLSVWSEGFWSYTCERLFLIGPAMKALGINRALHIENDNLIYDEPETANFYDLVGDSIGITKITPLLDSAGILYAGSIKAMEDMTDHILSLLSMGKLKLTIKCSPEMLNEMRLLNITCIEKPGFMKSLPILPKDIKTSKFLFDCASWGQFVGGTHTDPKPGYSEYRHIIGAEIKSGKYGVNWKNDKPLVIDLISGLEYPIFNLHIHSKHLEKWTGK